MVIEVRGPAHKLILQEIDKQAVKLKKSTDSFYDVHYECINVLLSIAGRMEIFNINHLNETIVQLEEFLKNKHFNEAHKKRISIAIAKLRF